MRPSEHATERKLLNWRLAGPSAFGKLTCRSFRMAAKKRVPFSKSLDTICEIVEERLGSMPAAEADAKRAEIHRIASRAR